MLQQVELYLNSINPKKTNFDQILYVFYGGGNDIVFDPALILSPSTIVTSLLLGPKAVLAKGAKNIVVFNAPPAQVFPFIHALNEDPVFIEFTAAANGLLTADLAALQPIYPQASLNTFDLYSIITKIVSTNSTYFTNTVSGCWVVVNVTTVTKLCNPEKHLFVDDRHFSSRAHGLIADAFRPFLFNSYQVNSAGCYFHSV